MRSFDFDFFSGINPTNSLIVLVCAIKRFFRNEKVSQSDVKTNTVSARWSRSSHNHCFPAEMKE